MAPGGERVPSTTCTTEAEVELPDKNMNTKCTESDKNLLINGELKPRKKTEDIYVPRIKWPDLLVQIFIHGGCLYGLYLIFTQARLLTSLWGEYKRDDITY